MGLRGQPFVTAPASRLIPAFMSLMDPVLKEVAGLAVTVSAGYRSTRRLERGPGAPDK